MSIADLIDQLIETRIKQKELAALLRKGAAKHMAPDEQRMCNEIDRLKDRIHEEFLRTAD